MAETEDDRAFADMADEAANDSRRVGAGSSGQARKGTYVFMSGSSPSRTIGAAGEPSLAAAPHADLEEELLTKRPFTSLEDRDE